MDQNKQEQLSSFSTGMNITSIGLNAVSRTVQVWSRTVGSTGNWYYGWIYPIGICIQAYYCMVNDPRGLSRDYVGCFDFFLLSLIWLAVHGVARRFYASQGVRLHSYEPGTGVLNWMLPNWNGDTANFASDITVALAISAGLLLIQCPVLSGWYFSTCIWMLFAFAWFRFSQARRLQQWADAQSEAEIWSQQIKDSKR